MPDVRCEITIEELKQVLGYLQECRAPINARHADTMAIVALLQAVAQRQIPEADDNGS